MVVGLDIESVVEIQGGAVAVELGAEPRAVAQDEIDAAPSGQHRARDGLRGDAFRSTPFVPIDPYARAGPDRYAHDNLVVDSHAPNGLTSRGRIGGGKASQRGQ